MRVREFLMADVAWQLGTEPPVRLERGALCVIVEGDRITGAAVAPDAIEAAKRAWAGGRMVEA